MNKQVKDFTSELSPLDTDSVLMQKEVWTTKRYLWSTIKSTLVTYFDTIYAKYLGDADFYQYSITRTVSGGNITITILNYEWNTPTATKPIKKMIGGVVRTISSALSVTKNAWTNWANAWSSELATKEIDWFVCLYYADFGWWYSTRLWFWRHPNAENTVSWNGTEEKTLLLQSDAFTTIDTTTVVNIGRFNATLSAGAGYTWSVPATSVIVNSPIYENQKQKEWLIVWTWINQSTSYTTSITMDSSSFTEYDITAQAGALLFNNPTGTPVNWQKRIVRIKDNGTARALTYGTQFASWASTLLTTTVISKKSWMWFEWDSIDSKWYCIASWTQP